VAALDNLDAIALRFWIKVRLSFLPDGTPDYSKCWPWQYARGSGKSGNYGAFWLDGRKQKAHRVAFLLHYKRRIPKHLDGAHTCDYPPCCNPTHVRPASHRANVQEWWFKRRQEKPPKCETFLPLTRAERVEARA
jgi:hypothetical protein